VGSLVTPRRDRSHHRSGPTRATGCGDQFPQSADARQEGHDGRRDLRRTPHPRSRRAYGFPFDHRASRFEEAFTIIRTLLTEGEIDFEGEYYTARDCQLVPRSRPEGPPIMIGSQGPRVLRATLPYVDLWNTWHAWHGNTPEGFAELNATIDEAALEVGRDPSEIGRTTALFWQFSGGHTADPRTGTLEELAEVLRLYESLGADHVQLVLDPITIESVEQAARALDLFR